MAPHPTINELYQLFRERLQLDWLAGEQSADNPIVTDACASTLPTPIAALNLIQPYCIQLLGPHELNFLNELGTIAREETLAKLFAGSTSLIILCSGAEPPIDLLQQAESSGVALIRSAADFNQVAALLGHSLREQLAEKITLHGVFMNVMGLGVLISGESAVGKSELALELITRNHQLIADDAPEFIRIAPTTIIGTCPEMLRDFLEVRGLGLLNIRAMFGESSVKQDERLRLIINLSQISDEQLHQLDRLRGSINSRNILDVEIPEVMLPVAPGRNLAVLVEAAVRNYILEQGGYDALAEFSQRQRAIMDGEK